MSIYIPNGSTKYHSSYHKPKSTSHLMLLRLLKMRPSLSKVLFRANPPTLTLLGPLAVFAWYAILLTVTLLGGSGNGTGSSLNVLDRLSDSFSAWNGAPRMLDYKPGVSRNPNAGSVPMASRVLLVVEPSTQAYATAFAIWPALVPPPPVVHCLIQIVNMLQGNRIPYDLHYGTVNLTSRLPVYEPPLVTWVYDVVIFENSRLYQRSMAKMLPWQLDRLTRYSTLHGTGFVVLPTLYPDYASALLKTNETAFFPLDLVHSRHLSGMVAHYVTDSTAGDRPVLKITRTGTALVSGPLPPAATVVGLAPISVAHWSTQVRALASADLEGRACTEPDSPLRDNVICNGDLLGAFKVPVAVWSTFTPPKSTANVSRNCSTALARNKTSLESSKVDSDCLKDSENTEDGDSLDVIFLGGAPLYWPFKLLLLDAMLHFIFRANDRRLESGDMNRDRTLAFDPDVDRLRRNLLDRWMVVDIDDGFVGQDDPTVDDVKAMIEFQEEIRGTVPNFTFNIGYSGLFYPEYNKFGGFGYRYLVENGAKFWWFPHSYDHKASYSQLDLQAFNDEIDLNLKFGKAHGLTSAEHYAVSPLHSGIFPVQEDLYSTWASHGIRVTSTLLYPHLYPGAARRGFIYRNISVLPRQTCGVFTHTLRFDTYPRGRASFDDMIFGGSIFDNLVNNMVNVFMTHIPNYVEDRLALYAMRNAINFATNHTNLRYRSAKPVDLAKIYFDTFPQDRTVLWQNPCINKDQFALWQRKSDCYKIPKILIVGPQKTGTTALLSFLLLHPLIRTNEPTKAFEEVQFFSDPSIYQNGIDWYINLFKLESTFPYLKYNSSSISFVEKSATYFDSAHSPERAYSLIPYAKIIIILLDPIDRAYSWYQHVKSHGDPIATTFTFHQVITFVTSPTTKDSQQAISILKLRNRILEPGLYSRHLMKWSIYYPPNQIHVIDGNELKVDPIPIMNELQSFLNLDLKIEYKDVIKYDVKKQFYCPLLDPHSSHNRTKCLGKSKGRSYPEMEERSRVYLLHFYEKYDEVLYKWLVTQHKPIPDWLSGRVTVITIQPQMSLNSTIATTSS